MARFLVVPQWQGSPAARAMLLSDGAAALAGDLPRAATTVLDVPLEAGESLGSGVLRKSALTRTRALVVDALKTHVGENVVIIGGDCGVTSAALAAMDGGLDDIAVIWCDAHPDLHTPQTSVSGAFSGMTLRAILGDGDDDLRLSPALPATRAILVGARSIDPGEQEALDALRLTRIDIAALEDPDALARAAEQTGAARVYVHIDVDVLDPSELTGVANPSPFGTTASVLAEAVKALRRRMPLAGATIAGFAPRSPLAAVDDLASLLRLVGSVA